MRLITADELAVRDACREVLTAHATSPRIRETAQSATGFDDALWKLTSELGWPALAVPETHGGLGMSVPELALVAEEFGRCVQPSPLVSGMAAARTLGRHGSQALCAEVLPAVAAGEVRLSGVTGPGGDAAGLVLRAEGAGHRLDGRASWVPEAQGVDMLLLAVEFEGESRLVLVDCDQPGLTIVPVPTLDLTRRHALVVADDVVVAPDRLLPLGPAAAELFELAVVLQVAESVGVAATLLQATVTYARQRTQFGVPIGSFQANKHRIADMFIESEAARVSAWEAAETVDTHGHGRDVAEAVSVAKVVAAPAASTVASWALQVHGGIGFTWEHDLHLFLRRAKVNEQLLGTVSWHSDRLVGLLR